MTPEDLRRIMCSLTLRTRRDPLIAAEMVQWFGFVPQHCDRAELQSIGRNRLIAFWQHKTGSDPAIAALALDLLHLHTAPSSTPAATTTAADAARFAQAVRDEAKAILRGEDAVTRQEAARRLAVCRGCPLVGREALGYRCKAPVDGGLPCNCFVRLKTRFRSQACPDGRW